MNFELYQDVEIISTFTVVPLAWYVSNEIEQGWKYATFDATEFVDFPTAKRVRRWVTKCVRCNSVRPLEACSNCYSTMFTGSHIINHPIGICCARCKLANSRWTCTECGASNPYASTLGQLIPRKRGHPVVIAILVLIVIVVMLLKYFAGVTDNHQPASTREPTNPDVQSGQTQQDVGHRYRNIFDLQPQKIQAVVSVKAGETVQFESDKEFWLYDLKPNRDGSWTAHKTPAGTSVKTFNENGTIYIEGMVGNGVTRVKITVLQQ